MRYRKLDEKGDYTFGRRDGFYFDADAAAQAVRTRLMLLLGEWWEDPEDGTPLFEEILGRRFRTDGPPSAVDLIISERVGGTRGVSGITAFESGINPQTREYYADITVKTVFGEDVHVSFPPGNGLLDIAVQ